MSGVSSWLRGFVPAAHAVSRRERAAGVAGALVGLFLSEWIGRMALGQSNPWFIAPMGVAGTVIRMVTQSDLVAALARMRLDEPAANAPSRARADLGWKMSA